jgi:hypothetical protein
MNQIIKTPAADTAFATGAFAQSTVVPIDNEPLVMGVPRSKSPVRFRVSIDGQPPGPAHGLDVNERGNSTVVEQRLYQRIRQSKPTVDRTFEMEFLEQAWRRSLSRSADGDARP